MRLLRVYVDTNIIIDYCWYTFFSDKRTKQSHSVILVNRGAMGHFNIHISFYTLMELSNHFTQYYLEQKAIKSGYGYPDSFRQRSKFELDEKERKTISELVERLRNSKYLTFIEVEKMQDKLFPVIKRYLDEYVEFVDAYHLRTAIEVGCDYLVTNDSGFRTRVQTLINKKAITEPIKMTSAQGFLNIIDKKNVN